MRGKSLQTDGEGTSPSIGGLQRRKPWTKDPRPFFCANSWRNQASVSRLAVPLPEITVGLENSKQGMRYCTYIVLPKNTLIRYKLNKVNQDVYYLKPICSQTAQGKKQRSIQEPPNIMDVSFMHITIAPHSSRQMAICSGPEILRDFPRAYKFFHAYLYLL